MGAAMIPAIAFFLGGLGAWALVLAGVCLGDWDAGGRRDDGAAFSARLGIIAGVALVAAAVAVALARAMLLTALAAGQGAPL